MHDPERLIESLARASYGRLVSYLAARSGDVAGAQDALADAFQAALKAWPGDGVPDKPEAWLLATARRRLIDRARHEHVHLQAVPSLRLALDEARLTAASGFPDERLKLLFVCAHPAIDAAVHTPLMLQVVLGLDAASIARAFLTLPATMGQRLSRAKTKIRDAAIAFEVPEGKELPGRLEAVLEAIYAAYGSGWDDVLGADPRRRGLTEEAIWLARVLIELLPGEPEARGLLALMLYCEARRPARRGADGGYVPISEQPSELWSVPLIREAERELARAASERRPGRFQLEAAVQSAHIERLHTGRVDWRAIALLYEGLVQISPTLGALVSRAAALSESSGPAPALESLDAIPAASVQAYQPYWAVRAHLCARLGRPALALEAYDRALALTEDPALRQFLHEHRARQLHATD
jgi:RNA polymerase sigma-70 factor (ECF subfamily)